MTKHRRRSTGLNEPDKGESAEHTRNSPHSSCRGKRMNRNLSPSHLPPPPPPFSRKYNTRKHKQHEHITWRLYRKVINTGNLGTICYRSTYESKKRRHRAVALMAPKTGMTGIGCGRRASQWKGSNKGG